MENIKAYLCNWFETRSTKHLVLNLPFNDDYELTDDGKCKILSLPDDDIIDIAHELGIDSDKCTYNEALAYLLDRIESELLLLKKEDIKC